MDDRSTRYLEVTGPAPDAFVAACPPRGLVARLGEKWALLAIVAVGEGPVRFGTLRRRLEGTSAKMLTQTLRRLERDGLVLRRIVSTRPVAVDYRLTALGEDLLPLAHALKAWAEVHLHEIEVIKSSHVATSIASFVGTSRTIRSSHSGM